MLHQTTFLTIYILTITFILGCALGSFTDCLAGRMLAGASILKGRSHCDACGHVLGVPDLVPLFSCFVAVSAGQMPLLWGKDPGGIVLGGTCLGDRVLSDRVPVRCFGAGTAGDTSVDCAFVPDAHGSACVDHTGSPAGGRSPDFFRNGSLSAGNGRTDIAWCSDGGWLVGRYAGTFTFI